MKYNYINKFLSVEDSIQRFLDILVNLPLTKLYNVLDESIYTDNVKEKILSGDTVLGKEDIKQLCKTVIDNTKNDKITLLSNTIIFNNFENSNIIENYNFNNYQFCICSTKKSQVDYIDFILPNDLDFLDKFIEEMYYLGFYYNEDRNALYKYSSYYINDNYKEVLSKLTYIRFLPLNQDNIRDILENNNRYLYHLTPSHNLNSIKSEGLKINNIAHPNYPKRIFLISPYKDLSVTINKANFNIYIDSLLLRLLTYHINDKNASYYLITIDLNKVPKNIQFYADINSYPYAVYTDDNLPADTIDYIEEIHITDDMIQEAKKYK